jgi:carbon storage regulator CsrA
MLVLTRKLQQKIKIGEAITVTILRVKGQTVRVGIDAPRDVRVVRGELPGGGSPEVESTVIEARLTVTDDEDGDSGSAHDDAVTRSAAPAAGTELPATAAPRIPMPLRLPQRKRFSRTDSPPLRVAHLPSPTLAK